MNDNSLWNKKASDLTVGDTVVLSIVSPILVVGGMMLAGGVYTVASGLVSKIRKTKITIDTPTEQ